MTTKTENLEEKWAIEGAMDTLQRAEAIKSDPAMMKKVKVAAAKKQKELAKIAGTPPRKTAAKPKAKGKK